MLVPNFTFGFSNSVKKKLLSATVVFSSLTVSQNVSLQRSYQNSQSEILNALNNSSIKEFVDIGQIRQLNKFLKPLRDLENQYCFVYEEKVAKAIVREILNKTQKKKKVIVVEANPGLGLITINLINAGVHHVYVMENCALQNFSLKQILQKYGNKTTKYESNSQKPFRNLNLKLFELTKKHNTTVKFVGIFTDLHFLRHLATVFTGIHCWNESFELYLILNNETYHSTKVLNSRHLNYELYSVLNLFFCFEEIALYPRSAFLPVSKDNDGNMYLIKMTNSDFSKQFKGTELKEFLSFLMILGRKKCLIIETLEKWVPEIGLMLISKGVSVTNTVIDFTPQECYKIFKIFQKCNGYGNFKNCIMEFFPESS